MATPPGEGGLGVVRVSGPQALTCACRLLGLSEAPPPGQRRVGWVRDPATGERVDQAVLAVWRGPRSYTGEDVAELSCHGSPVVLERVLALACGAGCRPAGPGEFTARAFLHGRLDLAQAEAVADLVRARTDAQRRASVRQLSGELSAGLAALREALLSLLARVEAGIDFSEEELDLPSRQGVQAECEAFRGKLAAWLREAARGRVLREGLTAALVGRPNVGKSSLLNALARQDRAIVTPVPGTTRDVVEVEVKAEGVPVRLWDTAGWRASEDLVERLGLERTRRALEEADLVLWVVDGSEALRDEDRELAARLDPARTVIVRNKADLPPRLDGAALSAVLGATAVACSAQTGDGIAGVERALVERAAGGAWAPDALLTNARHVHALEEADRAVEAALQASRQGLSEEFVAAELRIALDRVGAITGAVTTEDLLGRIFSTFCIGK